MKEKDDSIKNLQVPITRKNLQVPITRKNLQVPITRKNLLPRAEYKERPIISGRLQKSSTKTSINYLQRKDA
jgi:hypothetical protein